MASKNATTARFTALVQACGRPQAVTLWTKPSADKGFMHAVEEERVLTIRPDPETRRDYGEVGFLQEPLASYLVFPKPLSKYKGLRIVGIKYDLVEVAGPVGAVVEPAELKPPPRKHKPPPDPVEILPETKPEEITPAEKQARPQIITRSKASKKEPEPPPAPQLHEYQVTVEFAARREVEQVVRAESVKAARQQANQIEPPAGFNGASVRRRIVRVSKA